MKLFYFFLFFSIYNFSFSQEFNFFGIKLGMSSDEIISTIKNSKEIIPVEDILLRQLIPPTPVTLVLKGNDTNNNAIKKVHIDLYQTTNYQITLILNEEYFSFNTLSEKLLDKYGTNSDRTSRRVTWFLDKEKKTKLTLQYPNIIKIVDMPTLIQVHSIQEKSIEQKISESINYKEFEYILDNI
ncbi:MAG: hypothetical protein ACRCTJ_04860 [Brevinema sp.]